MKFLPLFLFICFDAAAAVEERYTYATEGDNLLLLCIGAAGHTCIWTRSLPDGSSDVIALSNEVITTPRYHLIDSPEFGNCSLNITDIEFSDRATLTCTIKPNPPLIIYYLRVGGFATTYRPPTESTYFTRFPTRMTTEIDEGLPVRNVRIDVPFQSHVSVGDFAICVADGHPSWKFNWIHIDHNGHYWTNFSDSQNLTLYDEGFYECEARNKYNKYDRWILSKNRIYVNDSDLAVKNVRIKVWNPYNVSVGDFAVCIADGYPSWEFLWSFKDLYSNYWMHINRTQNITLLEPGFYKCEARNEYNKYGDWITSWNQLNVTDIDHTKISRVDIQREWNEPPTLGDTISCETTPSLPSITYRWYFKKHLDISWDIIDGNKTITLYDVGLYYCEATNDHVWVRSTNRIIVRME